MKPKEREDGQKKLLKESKELAGDEGVDGVHLQRPTVKRKKARGWKALHVSYIPG